MAKNPKYDIKPLKINLFSKNRESYKFGFQKLETQKTQKSLCSFSFLSPALSLSLLSLHADDLPLASPTTRGVHGLGWAGSCIF